MAKTSDIRNLLDYIGSPNLRYFEFEQPGASARAESSREAAETPPAAAGSESEERKSLALGPPLGTALAPVRRVRDAGGVFDARSYAGITARVTIGGVAPPDDGLKRLARLPPREEAKTPVVRIAPKMVALPQSRTLPAPTAASSERAAPPAEAKATPGEMSLAELFRKL